MIYILGAPASQACFKVDIYLNFECLPNSEFLNYMPITPNNACIDPYYKKQAIAETQRNSIGKATETAKGNEDISKYITGNIVKVIYVPKKILNIIVK